MQVHIFCQSFLVDPFNGVTVLINATKRIQQQNAQAVSCALCAHKSEQARKPLVCRPSASLKPVALFVMTLRQQLPPQVTLEDTRQHRKPLRAEQQVYGV